MPMQYGTSGLLSLDLGDDVRVASMDVPIADSNLGFRLLQMLGWTQGRGLGKHGQGRTEPIRPGKDEHVGAILIQTFPPPLPAPRV